MKKITFLLVGLLAFVFQGNAQFSEDFEAGLPASWSVIDGGSADQTWEVSAPGSGSANSGTNVARIYFSGDAHDDYLITPQFTVTAGLSDRLTLAYRHRSDTFPEPFDILLSTTGNAAADFTTTIASAVTPNTTWQNGTFNLSDYIGQTVYIAFYSSTQNEWQLYLDDITVDAAPSCPEPTSLAVSTITDSSASFTWSPGGTEAGYQYAVLLASDPAPTNGTQTMAMSFDASGLTASTDYVFYVRSFCNPELSTFASIPFSTTAAQVPNNFIGGAIPITPSPEGTGCATAGFTFDFDSTTLITTDSGLDGSCNTTNTGKDQFFTWTATTDGLRFLDTAPGNPGIVVRDTSGNEIDCLQTFTSTNFSEGDFLTGWSIGQDLIIQIYDFGTSNSDVAFCLEEYTFPDAPNCASNPMPADGATDIPTGAITLSWDAPATGPTPTSYDLFAGAMMDGSDFGLVGNYTTTNTGTDVTVNGFNETVYYRIVPKNGPTDAVGCAIWSFTTEDPPPAPANDECAAAVSLTVNADLSCTSVTSGTIFGATDSGVDNCFGTEDDDVWYSFVATATAHTVSLTNVAGSTTDMYHAVYDAAPGCAALTTALTCSDPNTSETTGLTIGNTYFVQVYTWTNTPSQTSTFDICVGTAPAPPANDDCSGALPIMLSTDDSCNNALSGTTLSATASATGCTGGRDVWYSFTPAMSGDYIVSVEETFESASFTSTYVAAFEGICGSLTQIGSSTSCFNTGDITITAVGGTTYYYAVRSSSTSAYTEFDICVFAPPPPSTNTSCATAEAVACGATASGNSSASTGTSEDSGCTMGVNGLWYSFVGTGFDMTLSSTADFDHRMAIASGSCGSLTNIVCDDQSTGTESHTFTSTLGETYLVYIAHYSSGNTSTGLVTFSVECAGPANDECADATPIALGDSVSDDNTGATDSLVTGDCFNGNIRDLWYSLDADAAGEIYVNNLTAGYQYAIYSDCAGTLAAPGCNQGATGLTENSTYYIRISDDGTGTTRASGAFSFGPSSVSLSTGDLDNQVNFTYYPNPVKNTLTLNAQQNIENVVMYNMLGQEVLRLSPNAVNTEVDMSNLYSGAYFVNVSIAGATKTVRVIKQ